jgi:hypothetical protein
MSSMIKSALRSFSSTSAILIGACCLVGQTTVVEAQPQGNAAEDDQRRGVVLPDASFEAMFRKYTPPANEFSRLYSWDAYLGLNVTVVRAGSSRVKFWSTFQTAGTENIGSQVSVGGTGYLLGLGYVHTLLTDSTVSAGIAHLSSHLTRDLDEKLEELRSAGVMIPVVADPSEYNVIYVAANRKLSTWRFTPEFEIAVEPVNFRFNGSPAGEVRPVYLGTRWTLWRGNRKSIVARTQHEIGENPINYFSVYLERHGQNQTQGRLQIVLGASPGHHLHVSPNIGALRDGIALGIRMAFRD